MIRNLTNEAAVVKQNGEIESRDHLKNKLKKLFLSFVLLWAVVPVAYSQQYDSENDFAVLRRNFNVFIMEYNGTKQIVSIPPRIKKRKVIFIGANAFRNKNLVSVTIPNSVTSIRTNSFSNNNLTRVTIPNSVTVIFATAFEQNPITNITIGGNVEFIEYKGHKIVFNNEFDDFYIAQGRKAGTYTYNNGRWSITE